MKIDEDALYAYIARVLKERRRELNLTQQQLADLAKMERTSITHIESGRQKAPLHVLYRLCLELSLDMSTLLPPVESVATPDSGELDKEVKARLQTLPRTAALLREELERLTQK